MVCTRRRKGEREGGRKGGCRLERGVALGVYLLVALFLFFVSVRRRDSGTAPHEE
jgi:hypothetical protein